jgi:hypothetical protein
MDSTVANNDATATPTDGHGAALFAGFLGWTLDAFDFFLVVLSLTAIAQEFHRSDKEIALSITLTLAFRPVGAFIFGLMADRYGRRIPLMIDLVFYSVVEVATGFAHSFATFLVLRALFGIGMGGEWGVGASLAMEKVPARLRGFLSGLLQQGYALGYLLAAGCYFFVFPRWGWRPMFFIGGLPALLGLFVRFKVKESEVWKKTRHPNWSDLGRAVLSNWKLFLYLTLLMMMMNFSFARHAGYVSNFSAAPVGHEADAARRDYRDFDGRRNLRRHADRLPVRPLRTPPRHDRRVYLCNRRGPAVGLRAVADFAGGRRLPASVHGAGSLGHHSGAPLGIVARLGARISSRIRLSVRRAAGGFGCIHRGDSRRAHELRERHGADCVRCIHAGSGGGGYGTREEGH